MTFYDLLEQVLALLQRHHRLSYRALKLQFPLLDPACIDALRDELLFQGVARDAEGQGLIWLGRTSVVPQATVSRQPAPAASATELSLAAPTVSATLPSPETGDDGLTVPASGLSAPEAERRQLTVLFCDLVGSTQLSGQLDPEDLRAVVRAYQEAAAEVIQSYAGHIAQYLGDGLLVYFGYPTAHEDGARRAVHTGLGMVQAITTLNTRLAAQYNTQLAVRLGIHTGPVVVGVMGGGGRHERLALGETPNLAARLQVLAPANAVVISAVTARLVRDTFALEDLGTHTLPGVAEPLAVSRVRGLLTTPSRDDEFVTAGVPLLVGRDEEVGLLRRRWEQSTAGHGQVVLLSGEAGIGKSALVEGLRAQVRAEGLPRIAVRCSPYHTTSALYPVITHLERLRTQQSLTLHLALGSALQITKEHAAPEVEHAYTRARELCQQVGETPQLVPVLFGLFRFYLVRAQLHMEHEFGDTLLRLAHQAHDPALAVIAHYALGVTWLFLGALPAARQHLEAGIARYTPDQRRAPVFHIGHDPGVACRDNVAQTLWVLGYPDQALVYMHDALALAHELSHPFSLAWARCWAAMVSQFRRDVPAAHEHAEAAVALATEQGFPQWAAWGTSLRG